MSRLIELGDSTTHFLESLRGDKLRLMIESQGETNTAAQCIIKRVVRLFFDSSDSPLLYCISYLNKSKLTKEEYMMLVYDSLPIGTIFHYFNDAAHIEKRNISITQEINPALAMALNVRSELVFKKRYDYWVNGRDIGYICEFFNEESLNRI